MSSFSHSSPRVIGGSPLWKKHRQSLSRVACFFCLKGKLRLPVKVSELREGPLLGRTESGREQLNSTNGVNIVFPLFEHFVNFFKCFAETLAKEKDVCYNIDVYHEVISRTVPICGLP